MFNMCALYFQSIDESSNTKDGVIDTTRNLPKSQIISTEALVPGQLSFLLCMSTSTIDLKIGLASFTDWIMNKLLVQSSHFLKSVESKTSMKLMNRFL